MSVSGSVPTTVAFLVVPSLKLTEIEPFVPATATTWLLVRISPSLLSTMPEPDPDSLCPVTFTFTTEGSTSLATFSTVPSWTTEVLVAWKPPEEVEVSAEPLSPWIASYAAAPPMPATPPSTSAPTRTPAVRLLPRWRGGAWTGAYGGWAWYGVLRLVRREGPRVLLVRQRLGVLLVLP